jgi:hypothetical protein
MITNNNTLTEVLRASIKFEQKELALIRMIKYQRVARRAYKMWMELIENYQAYDKAKSNYEMWTLIDSKEDVHNKDMNKLAVYIRCMASYNMLKRSL